MPTAIAIALYVVACAALGVCFWLLRSVKKSQRQIATQLQRLVAERKHRQQQLQRLVAERKHRQHTIERFRKVKNALPILESRLSDYSAEMAKRQVQIKGLNDECSIASQTVTNLREQRNRLEQDFRQLQEAIARSQQKLDSLRRECELSVQERIRKAGNEELLRQLATQASTYCHESYLLPIFRAMPNASQNVISLLYQMQSCLVTVRDRLDGILHNAKPTTDSDPCEGWREWLNATK
jgi:chromosome segregation ATPase